MFQIIVFFDFHKIKDMVTKLIPLVNVNNYDKLAMIYKNLRKQLEIFRSLKYYNYVIHC